MQDQIIAMFHIPTEEIYPDNDTWILDKDLYPEDIFGDLSAISEPFLREKPKGKPDLKLINSRK